jgi:hypothetical protein
VGKEVGEGSGTSFVEGRKSGGGGEMEGVERRSQKGKKGRSTPRRERERRAESRVLVWE